MMDIPLEGKGIRQLCGTVLIFEAIVIGLAIPVAIVLEHANHGVAGGIGGALAVCAILIGGVVGRPRMGWALLAGTVLQVLVIAFGVVVPAMYALGGIFAALWITGIWLARRHQPAPADPPTASAAPTASATTASTTTTSSASTTTSSSAASAGPGATNTPAS
jgi:hypothetical protein